MMLMIHVDANTHETNPGDCAVGVVVSDRHGEILKTHSRYIGWTTNNIGEWEALLEGLRIAETLPEWPEVTDVVLHSDSRLVVNQSTGEWRVRKPHLRTLVREWNRMLPEDKQVDVVWLGRESNEEAHNAANVALDRAVARIGGRGIATARP